MVEFALLSPMLVALFLGVVFFGYDFYTYNRLEEVVRGGARFASMQTYDSNKGYDPIINCKNCFVVLDPKSSKLAERAVNFTVYGTPIVGGTEKPLVEGLLPANVKVSMDIVNKAPKNVWVSVIAYQMTTPLGKITLNDKPATVFPWLGRAAFKPEK